ncbi:MAG TPA: aminopeptidase P family protein [Geminicoccaceae bacterium]
MTTATPGDPDSELARLLTAAGVRRSVAEIRELIRGVIAAPAGHEPDAWLDLVAPAPAHELRASLLRLKEELASAPVEEPPVAERLRRLRRELSARRLDGLVVPLTDEHRNEYVPACAQHLAWLTGFTGSAGVLIVLAARAAVFVDGRYTVQAEAQLDPQLFERRHLVEEPPAKWLGQQLSAGRRIGYDPALHVKAEVERYRAACAKAGAELVALDDNPVDAVWTTRPAPPIAPIRELDERYAGESAEAKRARMGHKVAEAGAEVAAITAPDSIAWLLNARGGDVPFNPLFLSFALLHADGGVELFVDQRKLTPGQHLGNGVSIQPIESFEDALGQIGAASRAVLVDPKITSAQVLQTLEAAGARVIEGEEPCVLAKACKNPVELAGARNAQRRDGAAVCRFLCWLEQELGRREVTEREAAARLDGERTRDPLHRGPSFETISAAGPNAALPHYRITEQSNRVIDRASLYLVDSGGQYLDATTDVTRTIAVGAPSAEMRRRFTLVLKGHIAIARALFPLGTTGAQLDSFARQHLWRAGLDFDHGTGHGIGSYLCVHEGPQRIAKTGTVALKPGMIISNEPGYYRSGAYGIRTENLVIVEARPTPEGGERELLGFETITRAPIDRRLIVPELLDEEERAWLDDYHAKVRADVVDLVDGDAATWLFEATKPL